MSNKDISIYCLKYAESKISESMVFDGRSVENKIPISFAVYLIKTNDKNILVDAGCDTMPGFDMKKFYSPAFVLRKIGLSADDITDVIITHSHHDHIDAVKHFKKAIIHITKTEYKDGKSYIPDDFKLNVFEDEYIINPQLKIIECGGHSKGSSIVEIKTVSIIHILAGDECYTDENIEKHLPTGTFTDKNKSVSFIEKYSNKKYRVHTCHDISLKTERII